jgi:hypothetical protein
MKAFTYTLILLLYNDCALVVYITLYRVIPKSLRDFRSLRHSSRDGHDEREVRHGAYYTKNLERFSTY